MKPPQNFIGHLSEMYFEKSKNYEYRRPFGNQFKRKYLAFGEL